MREIIKLDLAEDGRPSLPRRRTSVRTIRNQQVSLAARFCGCTDGHEGSVPVGTRARAIRRVSKSQSVSAVGRASNKAPRRNSVVIADSNPVFLRGLVSVLQAEGDFVVVASCLDEAECIAAIGAYRPRLAVLDISLSEKSGLQILGTVRMAGFPTRVVFLSSSIAKEQVTRALALGASGIVPKDGPPRSLVRWLRRVMSGKPLWPLAVRKTATDKGKRAPTRGKPEEALVALTVRERQIMELVSTGLSNRDVAERLRIAEGTIKVHLHHIFQKLSIRNRTSLANIRRVRPEILR